ncbi:Itaconic acid 2-hydroxyparaconate biosynthesis cluster ITP1 [Hyphodiscus hymeniophilus]|uniref:Itaconic acid 2-hydroxyparaconate biosynthesis cluster ITP1 n=1 Tax=Hyphodiscus hymeniophilus TaxID=353542 RepID=A0A9P6VCL2_9HELO|nr:Itaconic acid 2-hydroxyparaconate biosynthesis cluster ITP1 [Hyphodiscus hymeniophilus]
MATDDKEQAVVSPEPPIPYSIFTSRQKSLIVTTVAIAATFSGLSANIYFPAIPEIVTDLSVTPELINLTVTSYLILQGLSPSVWGSVADVHGRRVTYICTFLILLGACVGLAETKHYYQLVILRCMQSTGSASTIAVGAGVVGDIADRAERGGYIGIYQAGSLAPLALGPILGGAFAETLGWRAIFWFLAIYSGAFLAVLVIFLPETLRSMVGNGSIPPKGLSNSVLSYLQRRRHSTSESVTHETLPPSKKTAVDFLAPLRMIVGMEVTYIIVFMSVYYTAWQILITTMSTLFKQVYGLSELQIGLTFIANGVGCIIGTLTTGKFLDFDYRRIKKSYTGSLETFPLEQARLRTLWLWSGLECASVLIFGWTLDERVHMSVPIISTFMLGWCATSIIGIVTTFMVDCFPHQAASATAAMNLVRCLMAAGGTAAVLPIVNGIGVGWTFTLIVGVMLASLILLWIQMQYGSKRRLQREQMEKDSEG